MWDVRRHEGANKTVVAWFAAESEAQADALARCISPGPEYVVFDGRSSEVGRAIFAAGKVYWKEAP